jgi:hypothetical protein
MRDWRHGDSVFLNVRLRVAPSKPLERFLTLMRRQLRRTAKTRAAGLCGLPAFALTAAFWLTSKR